MSYEEGLSLLESLDSEVEAFWIEKDGTKKKSAGLDKYILREID
jgi:hypothetical protein